MQFDSILISTYQISPEQVLEGQDLAHEEDKSLSGDIASFPYYTVTILY